MLTIDDDLGKSGSSVEGRIGFQRLVTEVGLNHVGLILGVEMSRLARSSKDWHQLLEICALFGTLIADLDGIYDPGQYNDRLLLGLKGTMSEAELHILKQRMLQGKLNKAKRGELVFSVPIGYVHRPSGEVCFDPDEQVQRVVRLVFQKFAEVGTLNAVLRYFVTHQIQLGVRVLSGLNKGDLEWRQPYRTTLQNILKNPAYTGAYVYGRRHFDPRKQKPNRPCTGSVTTSPKEWKVLIQDHHPAYISWEQYQQNLAKFKSNQTRKGELGFSREGKSLLTGLLFCGKCGSSMSVQYKRPEKNHSYICNRDMIEHGGKICQYLSGICLDELISEQVLLALEPAALELSLEAMKHQENERECLDKLWQNRLERSAFEVERAGRHYRLIEPENRMVARQLALEWETSLNLHQKLQEDYQRFTHQQPRLLSVEEQQSIRNLAQDIPRLWSAATTTQSQRKEIIRQLIHKIILNIEGDTEKVKLSVEWMGDFTNTFELIRPVAKWTQLSTYPQLCQRIEELFHRGVTTHEIVQTLNQEGFHPPKKRKTFNAGEVRNLMRRLGLVSSRIFNSIDALAEHEWGLPELANVLEMPTTTLHAWVKRGWVKARQLSESHNPWIIWADEVELERLRSHRQLPSGEIQHRRWIGEVLPISIPPESGRTVPS